MYSELQITFRGILPSEAVRDLVREAYGKARGRLSCSSCDVAIERAQGSSRQGDAVRARIELRDGRHGTKIFVQASERNAFMAVREAFARISHTGGAAEQSSRRSADRGHVGRPMLALVH